MSKEIELACVPSAIPSEERASHFALARKLFGEPKREPVELPDGLAFRFAADELDTVARFVANERRCCPFLRFEMTLDAAGGPLWLRMSGPEGTRHFLQHELELTKPCC